MTNLSEVVKHGTYYNPAYMHYNDPLTIVSCDRCNQSNISACIGFGSLDLCLKCVDELNKTVNDKTANDNDTTIRTLMSQNMFNNDDNNSVITKMKQYMLNKKE